MALEIPVREFVRLDALNLHSILQLRFRAGEVASQLLNPLVQSLLHVQPDYAGMSKCHAIGFGYMDSRL
jgi:hypothetical protein